MAPVELGVRDPIQAVERDLLVEFEHDLSREAISSLASEGVLEFGGAKVREFVPILAWRRARERARKLADAAVTPTPRSDPQV